MPHPRITNPRIFVAKIYPLARRRWFRARFGGGKNKNTEAHRFGCFVYLKIPRLARQLVCHFSCSSEAKHGQFR